MNGLTLAVIVTVCVGVTFATSYRPTYPTQDDDWDLYPQGSVGSGGLVPGFRGSVRNSFVGNVYPRYVRNGYHGVGQVGNSFVRSGLSGVLGHQASVLYPTQHQQVHVKYPTTGRRYKRSTDTYRSNRYDSSVRYPGLYPRYPQFPRRYPGYPTYPTVRQY
ncbi:uncharacterized protein LOC110467054 [Mizuhopecten yessoensis]|uniref:uncharacterized protein LOC110467054 n=1 Tax=Mizuhopecten yessoensis TaxID=6573 RepID=UPI000B45D508|nr:uncharacterized protein LOC110467054 [Mizuhopecten yessoensis]